MSQHRVYIAGPDVFLRTAPDYYAYVCKRLASAGLEGCPPSDGGPEGPGVAMDLPHRIYKANIDIIRSCDVILANINDFRGCEPDSGTCFEIGFAVASGIPVVCYVDDDIHYHHRVDRKWGTKEEQGTVYDGLHDMFVEQNGLHVNLMIACSTTVAVGLDAALDHIIQKFGIKG